MHCRILAEADRLEKLKEKEAAKRRRNEELQRQKQEEQLRKIQEREQKRQHNALIKEQVRFVFLSKGKGISLHLLLSLLLPF